MGAKPHILHAFNQEIVQMYTQMLFGVMVATPLYDLWVTLICDPALMRI